MNNEPTNVVPLPTRRPANVADAIDAVAHTQTLVGWLTAVEKQHRTFLSVQADQVESATGGAFNVKTPQGQALRTAPAPKVTVDDPDRLADWLDDNWTGDPDLVMPTLAPTRVTVTLLGDVAAAFVAAVEDGDTDRAGRMLVEAAQVEPDRLLWPQDMIAALTAHPQARVADDAVLWADPTTGEQTPVPGVSVTPSRRDLRVTITKATQTTLRQQLEQLIGPPALTGETP